MQSVFTQLILHYIDLVRQFFQAASGRRAQIHALEGPHVFFTFLDELLSRNESLVAEKNIEHYNFRTKHKGIKNGFCKHVIKQTVLNGCTRGSLVETLPSLPRDLPSFVQLLLLNVAGTRGVPGGDLEQPRYRLVFSGRQGLRGVEVPSGSAPLGIPFPLFAPADHLRVIGVLEKVNGNAKTQKKS